MGALKKALFLVRHLIIITFRLAWFEKKPRVIIVATPTHGNLGDQAIVYAERALLKKFFPCYRVVEIENGAYLRCKSYLRRRVKKEDIIVIDGGGNLGTLWPWEDDKISDIISTFSENKIIVFPQTAFYDNTDEAQARIEKNREKYSAATDLTFFLRDAASYSFFQNTFPKVNSALCPDIVLSINAQKNYSRKGILLCFRGDCEKVVEAGDLKELDEWLQNHRFSYRVTDTVIDNAVRLSNRHHMLAKKWKEFASSRLVITDRLHAMLFAFITGTPCIALNNKSKKVEGSYEFISECNYVKMAANMTEVIAYIPQLLMIEPINKEGFYYPEATLEAHIKNGRKTD